MSNRNLVSDQHGATAVEYALVALLIAVGTVSATMSLGNEVSANYSAVGASIAGSGTSGNDGRGSQASDDGNAGEGVPDDGTKAGRAGRGTGSQSGASGNRTSKSSNADSSNGAGPASANGNNSPGNASRGGGASMGLGDGISSGATGGDADDNPIGRGNGRAKQLD